MFNYLQLISSLTDKLNELDLKASETKNDKLNSIYQDIGAYLEDTLKSVTKLFINEYLQEKFPKERFNLRYNRNKQYWEINSPGLFQSDFFNYFQLHSRIKEIESLKNSYVENKQFDKADEIQAMLQSAEEIHKILALFY